MGRRRHNLLSHSNPHSLSGAPSLPVPQLPRKSGTGAAESGLELEPPPGTQRPRARARALRPDPRAYTSLRGSPASNGQEHWK